MFSYYNLSKKAFFVRQKNSRVFKYDGCISKTRNQYDKNVDSRNSSGKAKNNTTKLKELNPKNIKVYSERMQWMGQM